MKNQTIFYCSIIPVALFIFLLKYQGCLEHLALSKEGLLSGLLALAGFMFGARTFLVFKLQEVIYSNQNYIAFHKKVTEQLGFNQGLYEPLNNLDTKINHSVMITFISIVILSIYALFKFELNTCPIFSSFVLSFLFYNFIIIALTLISVNRNIKSIIEFWSADEKRMKDKL